MPKFRIRWPTADRNREGVPVGLVARMEFIVLAIRIVGIVVIFIIMAVVANTMAMTAL